MINIILNITYLSAICLSLYTAGWLLVKADKNRITCSFIGCQLLVVIWCIPQLFSVPLLTKSQLYLAYSLSYLGICFIGPAWLMFALFYSRKRTPVLLVSALFLIAVIHYSILLTNEHHHLFYGQFEVGNVVYGTFFYVHAVYTYLCVLAGMMVVLLNFKKHGVNPWHIGTILISVAVPVVFNLLYLSRWVKTGFDLTPPAFALSSILMLLAVYRYDFLDVNALAFRKIFESITEGVMVFNKAGKITYSNQVARDWFPEACEGMADDFYHKLASYDTEITKERMDSYYEEVISMEDGRRIEIRRYLHLNRKNRLLAGTFMFTDVSKYYELLDRNRELAVSNQKLAIERERNRIAQEVHDVTGHTLTMIHSLLKLIRIEYRPEHQAGSSLDEYLDQAQHLASDGIRELRCSINNLKEHATCELVTQGVYQLTESVRELDVEVYIQGEDSPDYSSLSPVVYECLREALTNCLRYAKADHMDVILKFMGDNLHFYIFDDGCGCGNITQGTGLSGIERRVEEAGGQVRITSAPGEGFQISIKLPVNR